jgi:mono/diheme cytochrome c family protein
MRILYVFLLVVLTASLMMAAGDAKAGKAVYDRACKSCHGADGTPNPAMAKMLKVEMRPLHAKEVQAMSDADMAKLITAGKGKMKAMPAIKGKELDDVVAYTKSLKK